MAWWFDINVTMDFALIPITLSLEHRWKTYTTVFQGEEPFMFLEMTIPEGNSRRNTYLESEKCTIRVKKTPYSLEKCLE